MTVPRRSIAWRLHEGEWRMLLILGDLTVASLAALAALALWAQLDGSRDCHSRRRRALGPILGLPLALWIMHFAWGGVFLYSLAATGLGGNRG